MRPVVINGNVWDGHSPSDEPAVFAADPPAEDKTNYILLETAGPISAEQRGALEHKSVILLERKGDNVYLCRYEPPSLAPLKDDLRDFVVDAQVYHPACAIGADVKATAVPDDHDLEVVVGLHPDVQDEDDYADVTKEIGAIVGASPSDISISEGRFRVKVPINKLAAIAKVDHVHTINKYQEATLDIDVASRIVRAHQPIGQANEVFKGQGETICVNDTGFDTGDLNKYHEAFGNRLVGLNALGRTNPWNADDPTGHGTHVAGCAVGFGKHPTFGVLEAPASKANLYVQSTATPDGKLHIPSSGAVEWGVFLNPPVREGQQKPRIHTNSWGTGGVGTYWPSVSALDSHLFDNQDLTVLFSAGNDGKTDIFNDPKNLNRILQGSLGDEGAAKNVITVGSSESVRPQESLSWNTNQPAGTTNLKTWGDFLQLFSLQHAVIRDDDTANSSEGLAAHSSRGPPASTRRIKPDVVAPGSRILSAQSSHLKNPQDFHEVEGMSHDPKWWFASGTSMSTPLVAGCCAVIRGALRSPKGRNLPDPSAALIKAILINGAVRLKGQYRDKGIKDEFGPIDDAPNFHYGFGRVNLDNSLLHILSRKHGGIGDFRDVKGSAALPSHGTAPYEVVVQAPKSASSLTLKVTLVWTDKPGSYLQNDLNLVVTAPDNRAERHGNMGEGSGFDRENNVEQVKWKGVQEGSYTIKVVPYDVQFGPQPFALAWRLYATDDL